MGVYIVVIIVHSHFSTYQGINLLFLPFSEDKFTTADFKVCSGKLHDVVRHYYSLGGDSISI
jgi:hypothetical protein